MMLSKTLGRVRASGSTTNVEMEGYQDVVSGPPSLRGLCRRSTDWQRAIEAVVRIHHLRAITMVNLEAISHLVEDTLIDHRPCWLLTGPNLEIKSGNVTFDSAMSRCNASHSSKGVLIKRDH
jgi:hypothetical protein